LGCPTHPEPRYETNIIYPPLYAGTCHVSPLHGEEDMVGGDFRANIKGIEHYRKFGYKGRIFFFQLLGFIPELKWLTP
jgi:hypothetical protein